MILAVLGACLLGWLGAALDRRARVWLVIALATIQIEERELRARFGAAYIAYAQRVPALSAAAPGAALTNDDRA